MLSSTIVKTMLHSLIFLKKIHFTVLFSVVFFFLSGYTSALCPYLSFFLLFNNIHICSCFFVLHVSLLFPIRFFSVFNVSSAYFPLYRASVCYNLILILILIHVYVYMRVCAYIDFHFPLQLFIMILFFSLLFFHLYFFLSRLRFLCLSIFLCSFCLFSFRLFLSSGHMPPSWSDKSRVWSIYILLGT